MKRILFSGVAAALCLAPVLATAQESKEPAFGPPPEVIEAWQEGNGDSLPGPPAWVFEMRQGGGFAQAELGDMPPWVARRHAMATQLGIGGPPTEVTEAWQNGEGFDLPGPPRFLLDLMQMMRGE